MAPKPQNASPPPNNTNSKPPSKRRSTSRDSSLDLNILKTVLGDRLIIPWFPSLFREELIGPEPVQRLYVCPRCFKYCGEVEKHVGHLRFCEADIPGHVVYAKEPYAIYELDGEEHPLFTQNLSLFAKLFIENKSVCFDVATFLYYLLVLDTTSPLAPLTTTLSNNISPAPSGRGRGRGRKNAPRRTPEPAYPHSTTPTEQIVGFFSKEKLSWDNNNLACILVFPPWQKTGLGQLLMGASYEISRREGRLGGPERPLSALGKSSYHAYWSRTLAAALLSHPANKPITIKGLSEATYMLPEDVLAALGHMGVAAAKPPAKGPSKNDTSPEKKKKKKKQDPPAQQDGDAPLAKHTPAKPTVEAQKVKRRKDGTVVVDKKRVREWVARGGVDVSPLVEMDGFVGRAWGELEKGDGEAVEGGEEEEGEGEEEEEE